MDGNHLTGSTGATGYSIPPWINNLALSVGTDAFGGRLIEALSEAIDADDCAAFQYDSDGVRTLAVGSLRSSDNTRLAAKRYENRFWKMDRFLLSHRVHVLTTNSAIYNIVANEIGDRKFRQDCYEFQDVAEQTSIQIRCDGRLYSLSAFWGRRRRRSGSTEFERLSRIAPALMSFTVRHGEICNLNSSRTAKPVSLAAAAKLIQQLEGGLSEREIAVCARILRGMTMHGIALELQLSIHSVITYKRRAFNRLSIATTIELFSLCVPANGAASAE